MSPQKFFISFNLQDREKAEWIAWTLKDAGNEVAVHTWEVPAGGDIPAWMNKRLAWADRLIAVISPDYVEAAYSMMEWQTKVWDVGRRGEGLVIPVIVRKTETMPALLKGLRHIDLTGVNEQEAAARLLQGVTSASIPTRKPKFTATPPSTTEQGPTRKPRFEELPANKDTDVDRDSIVRTDSGHLATSPTEPWPALVQYRSGDIFTAFFQKLGPGLTASLISGVGIYFLYLAWSSGLLWRASREPCGIPDFMDCRDGYLFNVSWSLTMVVLFPAVFYVITKFYRDVPATVLSIGDSTLLDRIIATINRKWIIGLYAILPVLWILYFASIREDPTWTWGFVPPCEGKPDCIFIVEAATSITLLGVLTTLFHVLNGLFIICLVRAVLIGDLTCRHVRAHAEELRIADADGMYGLSKLKGLLRSVYLIIALLTVYIVLYILDKVLIQGKWQNALAISAIFSGAWLFFFWIVREKITKPIEETMSIRKKTELTRLQESIEVKIREGQSYSDLLDTRERVDKLPEEVVIFDHWKTLVSAPILSAVASSLIVEFIKSQLQR